MSTILTQAEFEHRAASWADLLQRASLAELQHLFEPDGQPRQTYVSFDLATTITSLLSTVGIAGVSLRFVLHHPHHHHEPAGGHKHPRFGIVLYATDALNGRISTYYLNDPEPTPAAAPTEDKTFEGNGPDAETGTYSAVETGAAGQIPFNLVKKWIDNWKNAPQLSAAMFQTYYGPLQGYDFKLSDFIDPLFQAKTFAQNTLRVIFDLKTYYPAYPERQAQPTQTFGLVLRLYPPVPVAQQVVEKILNLVLEKNPVSDDSQDLWKLIIERSATGSHAADPGGGGGSSFDMSVPIPPGS